MSVVELSHAVVVSAVLEPLSQKYGFEFPSFAKNPSSDAKSDAACPLRPFELLLLNKLEIPLLAFFIKPLPVDRSELIEESNPLALVLLPLLPLLLVVVPLLPLLVLPLLVVVEPDTSP